MADTISPNMGLVVPGVGTEPSPTWATDLNSSLSIIDAHNHSPGSGVQVTPLGLNINTDLPFNGNNLTLVRSSRYSPQGSPLSGATDLGCVYVSGVDLYYNDENGNQIQITANGGVAGTSGSIANLVPPASASYVSGSKTFVWQSDANTPANMDNGSVTIRKIVASSPGITLAPPSALSADYTFTFPSSPPVGNTVMTMDSSGNVTNTNSPVVDGSVTAGGDITGNNLVTPNNVNSGAFVRATLGMEPGGSSNALIQSLGDKTVLISDSAQTIAYPVVISAYNGSNFSLKIVRGTVNSSGSIIGGEGFTVSHPSAGTYNLTYTNNFSAMPTIVASVDQQAFLISASTNTSSGSIITTNLSNVHTDEEFHFIVIGPR